MHYSRELHSTNTSLALYIPEPHNVGLADSDCPFWDRSLRTYRASRSKLSKINNINDDNKTELAEMSANMATDSSS